MVSTFARANAAAMKLGYASDMRTYLLIAGIHRTCFYFKNCDQR
jgi:hypothetical protein